MNLPKLFPDSTNLDVGAFLDFGNVWGVDYDKSINESNEGRSSTGLQSIGYHQLDQCLLFFQMT